MKYKISFEYYHDEVFECEEDIDKIIEKQDEMTKDFLANMSGMNWNINIEEAE